MTQPSNWKDISKEWLKKDGLKKFKLYIYWKKEKRVTKNKMERRCTQSDGRMWPTR
jgi:hypothetical protein